MSGTCLRLADQLIGPSLKPRAHAPEPARLLPFGRSIDWPFVEAGAGWILTVTVMSLANQLNDLSLSLRGEGNLCRRWHGA